MEDFVVQSPWFLSVIPAFLIFSVVPLVIMVFGLYFIIKLAVKSALKEYDKEK